MEVSELCAEQGRAFLICCSVGIVYWFYQQPKSHLVQFHGRSICLFHLSSSMITATLVKKDTHCVFGWSNDDNMFLIIRGFHWKVFVIWWMLEMSELWPNSLLSESLAFILSLSPLWHTSLHLGVLCSPHLQLKVGQIKIHHHISYNLYHGDSYSSTVRDLLGYFRACQWSVHFCQKFEKYM